MVPIRGKYYSITLIEILVVIAVLGVLAAFVAPNVGSWNCRQEIRNDFERLNGWLQTLRLEAVNRNLTMFTQVSKPGLNGSVHAYQGKKKKCIAYGGGWTYLGKGGTGEIMDYRSGKSNITFTSRDVCFMADGSAGASTALHNADYSYLLYRQCDGKNHQFKNKIFGATGFIEKSKYNLTTKKWDEL